MLSSLICMSDPSLWLQNLAADLKRLEVFDLCCFHQILHICWHHFISNTQIGTQSNSWTPTLNQSLLQRRLSWFAHTACYNPGMFLHEPIAPEPLQGWQRRSEASWRCCYTPLKPTSNLVLVHVSMVSVTNLGSDCSSLSWLRQAVMCGLRSSRTLCVLQLNASWVNITLSQVLFFKNEFFLNFQTKFLNFV